MLKSGENYDEVYNSFQWEVPEFYNIGVDICDKWAAEHERLALIYETESGRVKKYTFADLKRLSNRLASGSASFNCQQSLNGCKSRFLPS